MSERPIATLGEFMDEFVGTVPAPKPADAIKEIVNAVQGNPAERARTAVVDKVQESGAVPIVAAGVVSASSLLNPIVAAAQNLSHGVGTRVTHRAEHNSGTYGQRPEVVTVTMEPGDTIDKYGEKYAERMGVTAPTADAEIGAESGILPSQDDDIQVGTELKILLDRDVAVVPAGEGMDQVAKEHGVSPAKLEALNPRPNYNFVYVGEHLRLGAKPAVKSISKLQAPKIQQRVEQHVSAIPVPKKVSPKPIVEPKIEVAPVVKSKPAPAPKTIPKKLHAAIAPKPAGAFGAGLKQDLDQAFKAAEASVGKDSNGFRLDDVIHGFADVIQKTDEAITEPGHGDRHSKPREGAVKPGECTSTGHMFGKTNEQIATNYFVICEGDSTAQAAGVDGNLMQEDYDLRPTAIQNGGSSKNPAAAGKGGWGIAQWTPGSKVLSESKKYGIKGPIYTLQTQLVLVGAEEKGQSPTGQRDMLRGLKRTKSPNQAAERFEQDFEEGPIAAQGGGQLANRQKYAREAAKEFDSAALLKGLYAQSHGRHEHKARSRSRHTAGDAAIYYAALQYTSASYSETMVAGHEGVKEWHKHFPKIGPKALLDCSGLVNLAVASATGGRVNLNENTVGELKDTRDWRHEPHSKAGRGDLIEPVIEGRVGEHVEIISKVKGNAIYTFGAHTSHALQPAQVGPAKYIYNPKDVFLRYAGPDAPLGNGAHHQASRRK